MEFRNLGASGLKVSPLCLGTGFRGHWHGLVEEQSCTEIVRRAIDLGCNFVDCANYYFQGRCETIVGNVLKDLNSVRDNLVITSKVWSKIGPGPNDQGLSRYHIMREIERSLRRLKTDHIDIYLLHAFDPETPLEETLRTMDDLIAQGKTRYVGCCNFTSAQVVESLWISDVNNLQPYVCVQNEYNLFKREIEKELFSRCRQHGLGLMTYSPLAVGLLTGNIRRGQTPPNTSVWSQKEDFEGEIGIFDDLIQVLIDMADELGKTPAQVAVAWILDHPEVSSAIIGPDLPEHVDEVFGAIGWILPDDVRKKLDETFEPVCTST